MASWNGIRLSIVVSVLAACSAGEGLGTADPALFGEAQQAAVGDGACTTSTTCNDNIACSLDRCISGWCRHDAPDADGDGHPAASCKNAAGVSLGDDCADNDPNRYPGNREVCDANKHDEDCNSNTFGTTDADADGYVSATCCNGSRCGNDCNDSRADVHPVNVDPCDQVDNDCDGTVDENCIVPCSTRVSMYPDADRDGFGAHVAPVDGCVGSAGYAANDDDCDDANPAVRPGTLQCTSSGARTCGVDGAWTTVSCASGASCVAQPNATGVCL